MKRKLLITAACLLGLMTLAGGGYFVTTQLIDPDGLRAHVENHLEELTQQDITISGGSKWRLFPSPAIEFEEFCANCSETANLRISAKKITCQIQFFPLLRGQYQFNSILLDELVVEHQQQTHATETSPSAKSRLSQLLQPNELMQLSRTNIQIKNGQFIFYHNDKQKAYSLSNVNFRGNNQPADQYFSFAAKFKLEDHLADQAADISLQSDAYLNLEKQRYLFKGLELIIQPKSVEKEIKIKAEMGMILDMAHDTLNIDDLRVGLNGNLIKGHAYIRHFLHPKRASLNIDLHSKHAHRLFKMLNIPFEAIGKNESLIHLKLDNHYYNKVNRLNQLSLQVNDLEFNLAGTIPNHYKKRITLKAELKNFNLNAHLEQLLAIYHQSTPLRTYFASKILSSELLLPYELSHRPMQAELYMVNSTFQPLLINELTGTIENKLGILTLKDLSLLAYDGNISGAGQVDYRQPIRKLHLDMKADKIATGQLLQDLFDLERLTGQGHFTLNLHSHGQTAMSLMSNASGELNFNVKSGEIRGFNINQYLRQIAAHLDKKVGIYNINRNATVFDSLDGNIALSAHRLQLEKLTLAHRKLSVAGSGLIDLEKQTIQAKIYPLIANKYASSSILRLQKHFPKGVPLIIDGTIDKIDFTVAPEVIELLYPK